jgi:hypothetical protein
MALGQTQNYYFSANDNSNYNKPIGEMVTSEYKCLKASTTVDAK